MFCGVVVHILTLYAFFGTLVTVCDNATMKKDEIKDAPKVFCERAQVAYTNEFFILGLQSGNQGTIYSLTPQHAKRLQQYFAHQIGEYEAKNGEIDAKWDPNIVSPVQRANPPTELS